MPEAPSYYQCEMYQDEDQPVLSFTLPKKELGEIALGASCTSIDASRFANLWAIQQLDAGKEIPILDQTFFYCLMMVNTTIGLG